MRSLNAFLAVLLGLFAAVQWNDPDPLEWMLAYGAVALLCGLAASGRFFKVPTLAAVVVLGLWALTMLPGFIAWISMGAPSITGSMKAEEPHVEVVREFLGLLLALAALLHVLRLAIRRG